MPRASEYLLQGYTYHLTQRCHDRRFLLRFARDRDKYREWLREGVVRHRVPVYGFCITSNHVHVLAHADSVEAVSQLMHLASGATAKQYNLRKTRSGAMWEHPYHCTVIQDGRHLLNCLVYINLNMVRAGVTAHPQEWPWCSHDELVGSRRRYRILNTERLVESLGVGDKQELRQWYREAVEHRMALRSFRREGHWTESLVVGARDFVEHATQHYSNRRSFETMSVSSVAGPVWAVREPQAAYE
jgi:putative transposase